MDPAHVVACAGPGSDASRPAAGSVGLPPPDNVTAEADGVPRLKQTSRRIITDRKNAGKFRLIAFVNMADPEIYI